MSTAVTGAEYESLRSDSYGRGSESDAPFDATSRLSSAMLTQSNKVYAYIRERAGLKSVLRDISGRKMHVCEVLKIGKQWRKQYK